MTGLIVFGVTFLIWALLLLIQFIRFMRSMNRKKRGPLELISDSMWMTMVFLGTSVIGGIILVLELIITIITVVI